MLWCVVTYDSSVPNSQEIVSKIILDINAFTVCVCVCACGFDVTHFRMAVWQEQGYERYLMAFTEL